MPTYQFLVRDVVFKLYTVKGESPEVAEDNLLMGNHEDSEIVDGGEWEVVGKPQEVPEEPEPDPEIRCDMEKVLELAEYRQER